MELSHIDSNRVILIHVVLFRVAVSCIVPRYNISRSILLYFFILL